MKVPEKVQNIAAAILVVGICAVAGVVVLRLSHAATPAVSLEAEDGTVTAPAAKVSDPASSGSGAIDFASSTSSSSTLHYAPNANLDSSGNFVLGQYGFNLSDIGSASELNGLPAGVKGLFFLGTCNGADAAFTSLMQPFVGNSKLFGVYLMDEPDPTGQWNPKCPIANLKAESDWIHAHMPGVKSFIAMMNMGSSANPSYQGTYNPANSDIDLYGLDPYPCRTELNGCDYSYITKAVPAAVAFGIPKSQIVPVFQAFGGGGWADDGGGKYLLPTAAEENQIFSTWASLIPSPAFDYAYSWGSQNNDQSLSGSSALQAAFVAHNK